LPIEQVRKLESLAVKKIFEGGIKIFGSYLSTLKNGTANINLKLNYDL
jgi:hypothetical protein